MAATPSPGKRKHNLDTLDKPGMWLILIEALAALCLLVFAVWWIMFAGRRKGERPPDPP